MQPKSKPLLILGCIHIGFKYADLAFTQKYIDFAKKTNASVLLLSDIYECALPHKQQMMFDQVLSPQDQLDAGIKLLAPIAKQVIGYCSGNHSARAWNVAGLDIDKITADELGISSVYRPEYGLIKHKVGKNVYKIAFTHGVDSGADEFRSCRSLMKLFPQADICASSHNHICATTKKSFWEDEGNIHQITFISTGSGIDYPGYAAKCLYPPQPKGYAIAWLGEEEKTVSVDVSGRI